MDNSESLKLIKIPLSEWETLYGRSKYLYNIRTEQNQISGFIPNEAQLRLNKIREEEFKRSKELGGVERCKIILLKGRQVGGTTETAIINFDTMLRLNQARGLVLAHDDKSTPVIYEKYKIIYRNLPYYVELVNDDFSSIIQANGEKTLIKIKPEHESFSGYQLKFSEMSESSFLVRTAGSGDNVGKGDTINFCHFCLHEDALVILSDGLSKKIKDVNIGDSVIVSNGSIAKVSNKFFSGKKQTYLVKTWLNNEGLSMSKDHKVLTLDGWKKCEELTKDDWIKQPDFKLTNEINEITYELPLPENRNWFTSSGIKKDTIKLDYDFGYYVGYYLAEGHIKPQSTNKNRYSSVEFTYHKDETFIEKANVFASKYYKKRTDKERKNSKTKKTNYYDQFLSHLTEYVCGRVENKHIPEWFFKTNKEFIEGVLIGYYSGDGSKYKGKSNGMYDVYYTTATSIHEKITRQLKRLIIALDWGVGSLNYYNNKNRYGVKTKDIYTLGLSGAVAKNVINRIPEINIENNLQSITNKYKKNNGSYYVRVKSITEHEFVDTYDIEVDHPEHCFETPIGIVSNSEAANYEHFNDVLSSVNQSMPKDAYVYSIIESTANGVSGTGEGFYKMWMKSVAEWEKFERGLISSFDGYRPVFIPWYELEKYRIPLINGKLIDIESINFHTPEYKKEFLEMEEKLLETTFKDNRDVGLSAINWYRWCVKENCQYDILQAKRYYPTVPEDAFLSTDVSFFNSAKMFQVMKTYEQKEPQHKRGFLNKDNEFEESNFGELTIWEEPQKHYHNRYVVSLDPSYGIEQGDYACMFVFDRLEKKYVAKWYGNQKEDILAEEFSKLGYYYNNALLVPEVNLRTVTTLIRPDGLLPYEGEIYKYAVKSRGGSLELGYHTYGPNRSILLNKYNSWLKGDYFKIPDLSSLKEHITFIKKVTRQTPKYEAAEGMFDDQVIAMALCIEGDEWWDEEVFLADTEEKDILQIYNKSNKKRKFLRLTQLS